MENGEIICQSILPIVQLVRLMPHVKYTSMIYHYIPDSFVHLILARATPTGQVEGLKTITGGAVSFAPPPTPNPITTSRTGRGGGGANLHFGPLDRKPGEDFGRPSAGWL